VLQLSHDGLESAIAVSIDGNGRRVACDPYNGTVEAVLECAANLACVGAEPLGLTNCLNFGNPEKPHVAWQLERSVAGMTDALAALGVPVVGGNVSLYNESGDGPIYPTPVVGMVGSLPDAANAAPTGFQTEGDTIAFCGEFTPHLPGGELAKLRGDELPTELPGHDLAKARAAHDAVREAVRAGDLSSAHDVAEGGLLVAIAESCLAGGIGATLAWPDEDALLWLFGESPGAGFVVSGQREAIDRLAELTPLTVHGAVGGDSLRATDPSAFDVPLQRLQEAHRALARAFA
jgi:phosphoribosylformylglycinamidine synthase